MGTTAQNNFSFADKIILHMEYRERTPLTVLLHRQVDIFSIAYRLHSIKYKGKLSNLHSEFISTIDVPQQ